MEKKSRIFLLGTFSFRIVSSFVADTLTIPSVGPQEEIELSFIVEIITKWLHNTISNL